MPVALRLFSLLMVIVVASASAQEVVISDTAQVDSVRSLDNIVNVFVLEKKGLLPFGFKLGATIAEIRAGMGVSEIFKEDSTYITYTIYFSEDKYDFTDITFELDSGKVTDLSVEAYFRKKEDATRGFNLIKIQLDKMYKKGVYVNQALKWKYAKKEIKLKNKKGTIIQTGINLWIQLKEIEFEGDNGFVLDYFSEEPEEDN